ncbi:unnamed protein product [Rotaria sp. Silwood2]|nr:unnamed protein product [Rotaria sp. Silwood2]CAF2959674.1 unnamed protein product [Rotaria sp. Silwood2]CAF3295833.1 unnamed protein product [Rotaria sp. Silwood2]CAF3410136.1 unnamed protein product [Rotaria sp. Silwood2]CAF4068886.1 unnamed protein product [Rotaria sp. Silwood2]
MNIESIKAIRFYITIYASYIILLFGNIGCICNFITFTSKSLRQNSCGWYLLMSSLFDFIYINFGLFTKLASEHYGSKLQHTNLAWCRIRIFLTWTLPCFSTGYLVLASIDRCLSTSKSRYIRSFSQIKVAHQMTCVPIILYSLTSSHLLIYFNLRSRCSPAAGTYSFFLSIYSIVWTSLIPQISMFIFSLIIYFNVRKSHQRLVHPIIQQRNRTDSQMIKITLVQVLYSFILLNIRTVYYSYTVLSTDITKDEYRHAIEALLLQISSFIFYLNFSKSFFVNTLSSNLFRKVLKERLLIFYRRII